MCRAAAAKSTATVLHLRATAIIARRAAASAPALQVATQAALAMVAVADRAQARATVAAMRTARAGAIRMPVRIAVAARAVARAVARTAGWTRHLCKAFGGPVKRACAVRKKCAGQDANSGRKIRMQNSGRDPLAI